MVIHVVSEDMACRTSEASFTADSPIEAIKYATELSTGHDIDFVIMFIDGMPTLQFMDGAVVELGAVR